MEFSVRSTCAISEKKSIFKLLFWDEASAMVQSRIIPTLLSKISSKASEEGSTTNKRKTGHKKNLKYFIDDELHWEEDGGVSYGADSDTNKKAKRAKESKKIERRPSYGHRRLVPPL